MNTRARLSIGERNFSTNDEATDMAEMSNTLTNNLDALGVRFDEAVERHGKIRARLALVESERNLPGMLSRANLCLRQLETYKGDVALIEARVDELTDRCDVVCGEDEKIGYVGTGKEMTTRATAKKARSV